MPSILYTVDNLVAEIRSQLSERNTDAIDTTNDILPALNRAQDYAFDILARKYPEPILAYTTLDVNGTDQEYDIPEYVFEDRIQKLEVMIPSSGSARSYMEVQRISYRDISNYESTGTTNIPYYYCIYGRKIRFVPAPSGTYDMRMWYLRNPEPLALPQGRITVSNTASNYVVVDSIGSDLTTEADQLGSYVNLVDGQTGEIRGTLQIQSISEDKVTFRSTPVRSSVLGRTVGSALSALSVSLDDYLSPVVGTCVPYYSKPVSNFLIQFTVAEITRSLGGESDKEEQIINKFEKQIERTWTGREVSLRVKKKNTPWGVPVNTWWWRR